MDLHRLAKEVDGESLGSFKPRLAPTGFVAAQLPASSPRVRNVLKSERQAETMSPGVADYITLGIPQYASGWWLRTWWIALPGRAKLLKANGKLRRCPRELRITSTRNTPIRQRTLTVHVADGSLRVGKVLKSEWEVEAVPPGVADHIH